MVSKAVRITYWILLVLFSLFMLFSGISELMMTEDGNKLLIDLGYPLYLNYIIGVAKVLGVIAIVQPRWKTIKEWAYSGFSIDLIGASASFGLSGMGAFATIFPLIILAVMFVIYWLGKKQE